MKKSLMLLCCILMLSAASAAFGGTIADNQVLSQHVAEADNTSGQNTNAGAGIKTGHIQDDAITANKIAAGAVTAPKLGIICPDGQYLQFTVANGWICSVGTPGPAGPIGPQGPTGLQGPAGSQGPQGPAGPTYNGIKVVQKGAADGVNTFNSITAALNSIVDNSDSNRYAISVMPGIYEESIVGKSYVDIVGASRTGSIISAPLSQIAVSMADNMSLKSMTIIAHVDGPHAAAIYISSNYAGIYDCNIDGGGYYAIWINTNNAIVNNVSIKSMGPLGIGIFLETDGSGIVLDDIDINVDNTGVTGLVLNGGTVKITNVNISSRGFGIGSFTYGADYGKVVVSHANIYGNWAGLVQAELTCNFCNVTGSQLALRDGLFDINNSVINGNIRVMSGDADRLANSKFVGTVNHLDGGGSVKMINCYDGDYNVIPNGMY